MPEAHGALSNAGARPRPPPRESFTRRGACATPHLLFLCEVEAESLPAPQRLPAWVSGASTTGWQSTNKGAGLP